MKTRIGFTLALIFFGILYSAGQSLDYRLSDYKLPDFTLNQLDFNFNLMGNNQMYGFNGEKIAYHDYNNHSSINYYGIANTQDWQKERAISGGLNVSYYDRYNDEKKDYKQNTLSPFLNVKSINRFFYIEKQFFEVDYEVNYNYLSNKSEGINYMDEKEIQEEDKNFIFAGIPLKVGFGRIEAVQDARQAVYIFDELHKQHRLAKLVNDADILELATLISQLKNERFFDSRIQRNFELEVADSFLVQHGFINSHDIMYFNTLSEYWSYGRNQVRESGSSIAMAIYPSVGYVDYNSLYDDVDVRLEENLKMTAVAFSGGLEFKHEKPLNLSFQTGTRFSALMGIMQITEKDSDVKIKMPNVKINLEQRIGFYPNTRTSIDFFVKGSLVKLMDSENENDDMVVTVDGIGAQFKSGLDVNYYISPQFRINGTWSLNYTWQDSADEFPLFFNEFLDGNFLNTEAVTDNFWYYSYLEKEFHHNFRIALIYSIF